MRTQNQEKDFIYGTRTVMEAIQSDREIEKVFLQKGIQNELLANLTRLLHQFQIPYSRVPLEKLNRITKKNHQGVIAYLSALRYASLDHILDEAFSKGKNPLLVILDRITDVRNIGAIARTMECAGADALVIESKGNAMLASDAMKTSAGALNHLPVCRVRDLLITIKDLKAYGLSIIGTTEKSEKTIFECDFNGPLALILGSEENGVSREILSLTDYEVRIPMRGQIESLNVSVSAGIALYEILRQRLFTGTDRP